MRTYMRLFFLLVTCTIGSHIQAQGVNQGEILAAHNQVRADVGVQGLVWSSQMAALAQDWANQNQTRNNCWGADHRRGSGYGENLAMAQPPESATNAIRGWASEAKDYTYENNSCAGGCGHYTQIVWRDTREVGCGFAACEDGSGLWVCNYNPAGNVGGERPY